MSDSTSVIVRRLRPEDRAQWAGLWHDYLAFYETALPDTVYDATFRRLTDAASGTMGAFVSESGGRLTGIVHYIYHDHCWKPEGVCYLQDLFVASEARGTGAGRALIEAVYAAADQAGRPTVYWMTQHFNDTARKLYDRIATLTPFIKYQRS